MPRVKVTPNRRLSGRQEIETDELEESALDDEEISRLEQELNSLRREKAKQIRKMRYKREERMQNYDASSCSSDTEAYMDYEEDIDTEKPRVEARQSTRDLADGFEKAQKRFMFNVRHIEEKYRERERRGLPETKIEMDCHGKFYFPETMAGCHQQAFVNRLYQNDTMFGKGSVSAPRNSIQSFDGDRRALTKSLQLDEQFGRKLRPTENHHYQMDGRKGRIVSSAQVSGIPKFVLFSSNASSSRHSEFPADDYDDDDVFEERPRERQTLKNRSIRDFNGPSTSKMNPELTEEDSESKEENSVDDEETSGDSNDESLCDEDDQEEEVDYEGERKDYTRRTIPHKTKKALRNRTIQNESAHPKQPEAAKPSLPNIVVTPPLVSVVKSETLLNEEKQEQTLAPESKRNLLNNVKNEPKLESLSTPQLRTEKTDPVTSDKALNNITIEEEKEDVRVTRSSTQDQKKPTEDIRTFFKVVPLSERNTGNAEKISNSSKSVPAKSKVRRPGPTTSADDVVIVPTPALLERPARTRKPTPKVAVEAPNVEQVTVSSSHRHTPCNKNNSKDKKSKRNSSPFCKHCVLIEEEKKQAKLNASLNKSLPAKTVSSETSETGSSSGKVEEKKRKSVSNKTVKPLKEPESLGSSSSEQSAQTKRRSENLATEGPEKKKQKLSDSDLLSIPSSMAIVVDTELIRDQNPTLSTSNVPMFSDKRPTPSAWNSNIDKKCLKDFKKLQSNSKITQFFGVQVKDYPRDVPLINIWVDNIRRDTSDKDPFETDVRRLLAQDKKARLDVKAGYDVR